MTLAAAALDRERKAPKQSLVVAIDLVAHSGDHPRLFCRISVKFPYISRRILSTLSVCVLSQSDLIGLATL